MYGIIILSHNYWFSFPVDMLIILMSHTHADTPAHMRAHSLMLQEERF